MRPFAELLQPLVVTPPPLGERNIVISLSAGLSACPSVRGHICGTAHPNFTKFLCMILMTVAQFSSGGVPPAFVNDVTFTHNGLYGAGDVSRRKHKFIRQMAAWAV